MGKWFLISVVIVMAIILTALVFLKVNPSSLSVEKSVSQLAYSSPTPFPFQELTIPYLRDKEYKSTLGGKTLYREYQNYTAYLTSYTSDGLKINGLLTIPNGDKPQNGWPAIVFIHGYIPPKQYQTTERYIDYVDYLARNGFVVFKIDLRGNGDSEGMPRGTYYSSDYTIDTLNAYAALQSANFINPKKIGLWGHSMAGNIVMRSLAAKPDIPVGVIWSGAGYTYTDLEELKIHDLSYVPNSSNDPHQQGLKQLTETYGLPKDGNPFWKLVAPTSYLNDLKGAIQLNHAQDDDVVNIEYSRNLNRLLDQTKVPHELHEYPTGGHNIQGPSFLEAMQNTVAFFKRYLQ